MSSSQNANEKKKVGFFDRRLWAGMLGFAGIYLGGVMGVGFLVSIPLGWSFYGMLNTPIVNVWAGGLITGLVVVPLLRIGWKIQHRIDPRFDLSQPEDP